MIHFRQILNWNNPVKTGGILLAIINGIGIIELWMIPVLLIGPFLYHLMIPAANATAEVHFYAEDKEAILILKAFFLKL